ncbi:MAG: hypothetical protein H7Z38_03955 [Rubrivivax sp.]|nr:hypothetical protein [Pyrinomonadaceae bacterium]
MKIALISIVALIGATALVIYLSSGKGSTPQSQAGNTNIGGQSPANVAAHDNTSKPPDAINRPQPQAVVKPSVVEIVIPVDGSRKWEWGGVEAPKTGEHEYHWEVELYGENGYYKFSVYLNQAKKGGTADDFTALVNEMSQAIYAWDEGMKKWVIADATVPLNLEFDATPDGLIMTVTGKDVKRFYVSKSKTAIFRILMPDQKEELKTVPVVYKES